MSVLTSYGFLILLVGAGVLAAIVGAVGTLSVLQSRSLIGDVIGHASFPGVVLAYMIFQSRSSLLLLLGAACSGLVAYFLISFSARNSKINPNSILAVTLSAGFGLGLLLKSYIVSRPDIYTASQSGLAHYIFGQAAYLQRQDVYLIVVAAILCTVLLIVFYKDLKLYLFDPNFARTQGYSSRKIEALILFMTLLLIVLGLKTMGVVLISGLLIAPAIAAFAWTHRFGLSLILAAVFAAVSAGVGAYVSSVGRGFATGPVIIIALCSWTFFSLLFGPRGELRIILKKRFIKSQEGKKQ